MRALARCSSSATRAAMIASVMRFGVPPAASTASTIASMTAVPVGAPAERMTVPLSHDGIGDVSSGMISTSLCFTFPMRALTRGGFRRSLDGVVPHSR